MPSTATGSLGPDTARFMYFSRYSSGWVNSPTKHGEAPAADAAQDSGVNAVAEPRRRRWSPQPTPPPSSTASVAICQLMNLPCPRLSTFSKPPEAFSAVKRASPEPHFRHDDDGADQHAVPLGGPNRVLRLLLQQFDGTGLLDERGGHVQFGNGRPHPRPHGAGDGTADGQQNGLKQEHELNERSAVQHLRHRGTAPRRAGRRRTQTDASPSAAEAEDTAPTRTKTLKKENGSEGFGRLPPRFRFVQSGQYEPGGDLPQAEVETQSDDCAHNGPAETRRSARPTRAHGRDHLRRAEPRPASAATRRNAGIARRRCTQIGTRGRITAWVFPSVLSLEQIPARAGRTEGNRWESEAPAEPVPHGSAGACPLWASRESGFSSRRRASGWLHWRSRTGPSGCRDW